MGANAEEGEDRSIMARLASQFQHKRGPKRLSVEAVQSILQCEADYVEQLTAEAARLARSQRVDDVSKNHVEQADMRIRSHRQGIPLLETIGGMTGGAALAAWYQIETATDPNYSQYRWVAILLIITFVLFYKAQGRR